MTKKKPKKFKHVGWVIKSPRGCTITSTARLTRMTCIKDEMLKRLHVWSVYYRRGWRCVKVFVEEA